MQVVLMEVEVAAPVLAAAAAELMFELEVLH
jgi:hypothetical protein